MGTSEPFSAGVPEPVRLHVFLAGEPLWTAVTFVRPHTRMSHHVAFQVPGARKFPSANVTVQLARLLVEFAVFPKVVNCLELLSTVIVWTSKPFVGVRLLVLGESITMCEGLFTNIALKSLPDMVFAVSP